MCDPAELVPCVSDDATASIPLAGTGLALTWSSLWAPARLGRPDWDVTGLGLGGWSVSAIEGFAPKAGILIGGDGAWRAATTVDVGGGEGAIPAYDGSVAYVFDGTGRHVRTVDGRLGLPLLTISYDGSGRLTSLKGTVEGRPVGLSVKRASDGTPTALDGIDGTAVQLTLDPQGRLSALRDTAGNLTAFQWLPGGLLGSVTDPMGGMTQYTYDESGRLASATDADGVATRYAATVTGTSAEITATTPLGRTTTYRTSSESTGTLTRTLVEPDGMTATEVVHADGSQSITYADGTTVRLALSASALWGMDAPVATSLVTATPGRPTTTTAVTEALRPVAASPFAVSGTVTTTVDGDAWVTTYDPAARTVSTVDPAGRHALLTYDDAGRPLSTSVPGQAPVATTYDAAGRVASRTIGTGAGAMTWRFAYDASTGRVTTTRPDGGVTTQSFDALGDAVAWTAADGSTTLATYDLAGHATGLRPPGGLDFTLGSTAAGRFTAFLPPSIDADGAMATTTYDADGRASSLSGPGPRAVTPRYDAAGRLTGWTTGQGETTLTYGTGGRLTAATDASGVATGYDYSGDSLTELHWTGPLSGSVATSLDGLGHVTALTVDGGAPIATTYDPAGLPGGVGSLKLTRDPATGFVITETIGTIETDLSYDAAGSVARSTTKVGGAVVLERMSTRDALGRVSSVAETRSGGSTTTGYTYDAADRLASVTVDGQPFETDTYDAAGDRTSVKTVDGTTKARYDDRQRLTGWGAATYRWGSDGTLASVASAAGSTTFSFDDLRRLTGVTLPGGRTITYLLDAEARRVGREVDGILEAGYLYDPAGRVVAVTDGHGTVTQRFAYDEAGHLALIVRGTSTDVVVTDDLGSPRLVLDASTGAIADEIEYDAWGRVTTESSAGSIPFGFAGGLRDVDTGLVHFGARDYDPVTGRWISPDPIGFAGGDANLYRYVLDEPVNGTDPSGLRTCYTHANEPVPCDSGPKHGEPPRQPPNQPPSQPPSQPTSPPKAPPSVDCFGACYPPNPHGGPGYGWCQFGTCDFGSDGNFKCLAVACAGPNGAECYGYCYWGDTHVLTGDRAHYDFQAAGEFVAARTPDGSTQVQVRQEPVLGGTTITFATAIAVGVAGDRVGVYAGESAFLRVNGVAAAASDLVERLPHGGTVERHGGTVTIGWPDGSRLTVVRVAQTLDVAFAPSAAIGPTIEGLLGSADGNAANDLTGRDGAVLSRDDPAFATKVYVPFGNSWRLRPAESLFDYGSGESTATFSRPGIPSAEVTAGSLPADRRASAQAICLAVGVRREPLLDDCVLDVAETGDPGFAAASAWVAAAGPLASTSAESGEAPAAAPTPIALGQDVSGTLAAATGTNDYTFAAAAGEIVYGHAEGTCVAGLQWVLLGPDGALLAMGPGTCQEIGRVVLATAGTYTLRVRSDGVATGSYRFVLSAVPPTVTDVLGLGGGVSGSIDAPGQWHDYTLVAVAGQRLTVEAHGACTSGLGWRLLKPDGALLDFHPACGTMGPDTIGASGTYTLRVLGDGAATGAFGFTVKAAP